MAFDKTNTGTLAKNPRKTQDTHPDIAGTINVEGREFWLNGWSRENKQDGSKFYSLSVKPKEARQEASAPPASQSYGDKSRRQVAPAFDPTGYSPADDDSDPIPF